MENAAFTNHEASDVAAAQRRAVPGSSSLKAERLYDGGARAALLLTWAP